MATPKTQIVLDMGYTLEFILMYQKCYTLLSGLCFPVYSRYFWIPFSRASLIPCTSESGESTRTIPAFCIAQAFME